MKRSVFLILLIALALPAHAELVLRQSTASQAVLIGPFVDSTDGDTAETALTIDAADVRISVNGANTVGKNSGGCTHDELGMYACTFDATDTATVGRMQVYVKESGALIVYHEFQVAEEAVYDSCCAASAAPLTATDIWAAGTRTLTAGTNIVLAKGTGVTGFNDLSAAQVNSEVDTALTDIHLDHLLAADYDPASKPGVSTALLNELIQSDAGVSQFTANALETAPSGSSITDWTADERTAIRAILGVPGSGTTPADPSTGILDTIRGYIDTEVAAILVDTGTTLDGKLDTVDTVADAIKVKTDQLTFGVTNTLNANVEYTNATQMCGVGTSGDKFRACP
jgi:hypothetical protein